VYVALLDVADLMVRGGNAMGKQQRTLDWRFLDEKGLDDQAWQTVLRPFTGTDHEMGREPGAYKARGLDRWWQFLVLMIVILVVSLWYHPWQSSGKIGAPSEIVYSKQLVSIEEPKPSVPDALSCLRRTLAPNFPGVNGFCGSPDDSQAPFRGPAQWMETGYFVYRFQPQDAAAVAEVATQMDAVYSTLRKDLGLPAAGKQLTITVRAEDIQLLSLHTPPAGSDLTAHSPDLAKSQVEFSPAEILHQSVVYLLGEQVLAERFGKELGQPTLSDPFASGWSPLIGALRLWQLGDAGGPLATLQRDLVTWLYGDADVALPDRYGHICNLYQMWRLTPLMMSIPLTCTTIDPIGHRAQPPLDLRGLGRSAAGSTLGSSEIEQRAKVIALETVLEYVVATYGREHLPVFIHQLSQHEDWDTVIPAVFKTPVDKFQEGWRRLEVHQLLSDPALSITSVY
jgi:hypothetical protein